MSQLTRLNATQSATVDQDNRNMAASSSPGPMSGIINEIFSAIDTGPLGINSASADIDSMCLGGGEFTQDLNTAPASTTLLFAWLAGRFHNGKALVSVAAGSLTLAASQTNYVQVNRAGVVSSNTSGFTSGQLPLFIVVTGSSNWVQANVTSFKPHMTLIGTAGVTGDMLSTAGGTKEIKGGMGGGGSVSATTSVLVIAPNIAAILNLAMFACATTVAANDTNYWTWSITNLGQAGAGSTAMLSAGASNTTKATGGTGLTANGNRSLTLHGTPGTDANLNVNPNDVLQITLTATGAPTALTQVEFRLDFAFTG